jgi:hypothetical protein
MAANSPAECSRLHDADAAEWFLRSGLPALAFRATEVVLSRR